MKLLKEITSADQLDAPIYAVNQYVILSKERLVLSSGTFEECIETNTRYCGYYDNCFLDIRRHDFHLGDNRLVGDPLPPAGKKQYKYRFGDGPWQKGYFTDIVSLTSFLRDNSNGQSYSYSY